MTSALISPGAIVFDIGANIGELATQFKEAGAGNVIAVEPVYEVFSKLRNVPGIVPIHAAAWSSLTMIPVSYCPVGDGTWSSCLPDKWIKAVPEATWNPPQWVPTTTLDELIEIFGKPSLIKIDVEGAEFEVLIGLRHKPDFLMFEFNQAFPEDALDCLSLLERRLKFTKAHYTCTNLDLETIPTMPIEAVKIRWLEEKPAWGNFTVA